MKYLFINLKSNMDVFDINKYISSFDLKKKNLEIAVAPSTLFLPYFVNKNISMCSQDVSRYNDSITGEVTAKQLKSIGVKYSLVGHFERRKNFREDSNSIINKINNLIENDIVPVYILNEIGTIMELKEVIPKIKDLSKMIFCYEPSYLIGKKSIADFEEIKYNTCEMRKIINGLPLLYGGSVNENTIKEIEKLKLFDGYIVGSAGIIYENVKKIVEVLNG